MGKPQPGRFVALDMLRGIAALAIVTRHFPWPGGGGEPMLLPRDYLAVDLFFVLSGFVIAHAYGGALAAGRGTRWFLIQRIARLGPLYLLATLAGAAIALGAMIAGAANAYSPGGWATALGLNLFLLPAPPVSAALADVPYPFVGPAWSLFWELAINLVFALVFAGLTAARLGRILVLGLVLLAVAAASHGSLDMGPYWSTFSGGACRVIWSFFAGVALYRLRERIALPVRLPDWAIGLALIALFLPPMAMPLGGLYDFASAAVALPLLVLLGADARTTPLSRGIGHWLGYCSYGVYVLHGPVLMLMEHLSPVLTGRDIAASGWAGMALLVMVSLAAAYAATRWIDTPARAWLKHWLQRGRVTTTRPAAP